VTIAVSVEGKASGGGEPGSGSDATADGDGDSAQQPASESASAVRAVYVADTDVMLPDFLQIRAEPDQIPDTQFQFQNVTFLLNTIDWLTGETEYIQVRNHQPMFTSLRLIDSVKEEATSEVRERSREFQQQFDEQIREAQEKMDEELQSLREEIERLKKESEDGTIPRPLLEAKVEEFEIKQRAEQQALEVKRQKSELERERRIREIQRAANQEVTEIQNDVKAAAVVIPCIPPLIVGIVVFASRRLRERENISKSRLK
jgi:ABC-2 type transport system permease protein